MKLRSGELYSIELIKECIVNGNTYCKGVKLIGVYDGIRFWCVNFFGHVDGESAKVLCKYKRIEI